MAAVAVSSEWENVLIKIRREHGPFFHHLALLGVCPSLSKLVSGVALRSANCDHSPFSPSL